MKKLNTCKWILLITLALLLPVAALAQPAPEEPFKAPCSDKKYTGVLSQAVSCVETVMQENVAQSIDQVLEYMSPIVAAALTLYIIFYGMDVILRGNQQNLKAEFLMKIVKFMFVAMLTYASGQAMVKQLYPMITEASFDMANIVTSNMNFQGQCSNADWDIWQRSDCIIASFTGVSNFDQLMERMEQERESGPQENTPQFWEQSNFKGFFLFDYSNKLLASPYGWIISVFVVGATFLMLITFGVAIFMYIAAMLAIGFLFLLTPIMLPLILFEFTKRTTQIWFLMLLGYVIQPALLFAYLAFSLSIINVTLYGADGERDENGGLYESLLETQDQLAVKDAAGNPVLDAQGNPVLKPLEYKALLRSAFAVAKGRQDPKAAIEMQGKREAENQRENFKVPNIPIQGDEFALVIVGLLAVIVMLYILYTFLFNLLRMAGSLTGTTTVSSLGSALGQTTSAVTGAVGRQFQKAVG